MGKKERSICFCGACGHASDSGVRLADGIPDDCHGQLRIIPASYWASLARKADYPGKVTFAGRQTLHLLRPAPHPTGDA